MGGCRLFHAFTGHREQYTPDYNTYGVLVKYPSARRSTRLKTVPSIGPPAHPSTSLNQCHISGHWLTDRQVVSSTIYWVYRLATRQGFSGTIYWVDRLVVDEALSFAESE